MHVILHTGRTHQIRVQFSSRAHSLLGDGKYGINRDERSKGFKYQALYAYKLYFKRTGDDNALSYLEDKTFSLDKEDIWFLKE